MSTKDQIIKYIEANEKVSVEELRKHLYLSRQIIHRHLNDLADKNLVDKVGRPPNVYYRLSVSNELPNFDISQKKKDFLESNFLWISPQGEMFTGVAGFIRWVVSIKQENQLKLLLDEFIKTRKEANIHLTKGNLVDATFKLTDVFGTTALKKLYYLDFYSLPKFGKTPIGQYVLHSKQAQNEKLIADLALRAEAPLQRIIIKHKIDAVSYIPHTVKRNVQFLKVFEDRVGLGLPRVDLVKAYKGEIPIAQKTLPKLEQRVENASQTIYVKNTNLSFNTVLLIDDAIGSGASMNEVAKKLLYHKVAQRVYGFALVGSYKGFDVISEV